MKIEGACHPVISVCPFKVIWGHDLGYRSFKGRNSFNILLRILRDAADKNEEIK